MLIGWPSWGLRNGNTEGHGSEDTEGHGKEDLSVGRSGAVGRPCHNQRRGVIRRFSWDPLIGLARGCAVWGNELGWADARLA